VLTVDANGNTVSNDSFAAPSFTVSYDPNPNLSDGIASLDGIDKPLAELDAADPTVADDPAIAYDPFAYGGSSTA
jgi:hypothetical protein